MFLVNDCGDLIAAVIKVPEAVKSATLRITSHFTNH